MRRHNHYTIVTALQRSDTFVMRAAIVLYKRQTWDEKLSGMSVHVNWLGFNRADSEVMTAIVEEWKAGNWKTENISADSIAIARRRVAKYAKQLAKHANGHHVDFGRHASEVLSR